MCFLWGTDWVLVSFGPRSNAVFVAEFYFATACFSVLNLLNLKYLALEVPKLLSQAIELAVNQKIKNLHFLSTVIHRTCYLTWFNKFFRRKLGQMSIAQILNKFHIWNRRIRASGLVSPPLPYIFLHIRSLWKVLLVVAYILYTVLWRIDPLLGNTKILDNKSCVFCVVCVTQHFRKLCFLCSAVTSK
jgi:hypothetical protein